MLVDNVTVTFPCLQTHQWEIGLVLWLAALYTTSDCCYSRARTLCGLSHSERSTDWSGGCEGTNCAVCSCCARAPGMCTDPSGSWCWPQWEPPSSEHPSISCCPGGQGWSPERTDKVKAGCFHFILVLDLIAYLVIRIYPIPEICQLFQSVGYNK